VNPLIGSSEETVKRKGVDIVFGMDVSKSMLAEDIVPNRLEKSKRIVNEIVDNLAGDRVGIIAYAGSAFPQLPITTDYGAVKQFTQALNTDMVSSQGTAIDEAIKLSKSYYDDESRTKRVLFLLSDGENHAGNLEDISKEAAEKGIRIFTIGLGTEKGAPIPIKKNGVVQRYKKDRQGETVITKTNHQTLKNIAKATGGKYIEGSRQTKQVIEDVKNSLKNIEKTDFESKRLQNYDDQFQWFVGFGIFFMVIEILLLERKTSWVQRLNLFKEKRD
jgi:Ca-activated chloride channel family protein